MAKRNSVRGPQQGAPAVSRVVYGPQGSGKTFHGQEIAAHLGLQHVRDLEDVLFNGEWLQHKGHLYLTYDLAAAERATNLIGSDLLHIDNALAMIGADSKGVARA